MPDYGCFPVWCTDLDNSGSIEPNQLPISQKLKRNLITWANRYDNTLNDEDPSNSGFESKEDEQKFKEDGMQLYQRLQKELGEEFKVTFFIP